MLPIKRRHFLQFAGSTLAAVGLSQMEIESQALRYARVLAQDTPRKRALLVGINRYDDPRWLALNGAVNDAKLQQELLIHRFGFDPNTVLTLTDQAASRENILQAFEEHLIQWAKPGDVVVFHFSGHGSQVADPDKVFDNGRVSTIVPIDSSLPPGYPNKSGKVADITGHTLWLLMQAINSENVTFVLDSCHSGGARKGTVTVRSRPGDAEMLRTTDPNIQLLANSKEQEHQQQLMSRLNMNPSDLAARRKQGVPKGVMLAAARQYQAAIDASFADTPAGIFTYVLTRYLWQQTGGESVNQVMASATTITQRILQEYFPTSGLVQQPEFNIRQGSSNGQQAVYFTSRQNTPAEAVVTKVEGDRIDLFLGGIDPRSLEAFGRGATLTLVSGQIQVQIESRQQLTARAKLIHTATRGIIAPGALLQERSRAIPSNLTLKIGLDPSLGQEIEQAKQALQAIKRIEAVPLQQQEVQYILGRITKSYYQQLQKLKVKNLPEVGNIALFSPALDLIPSSAGTTGESITDALKRLQPKLKSLLATRIVKLTLNTNSSRLSIAAAMQTVDGSQLVAEAFTVRGATVEPIGRTRRAATLTSNAQKMFPGTQVEFLVRNNESRPLYISVLLISADGELSVLSPLPGNEDTPPVAAGQEIQIPDPDRGELYRFKIGKTPGIAEVLVIASATPLTRAIELLRALAAEASSGQRGLPVELNKEPAEAIASLLNDLNEGSRGGGTSAIAGIHQIDTKQMAALSITFEVTNDEER